MRKKNQKNNHDDDDYNNHTKSIHFIFLGTHFVVVADVLKHIRT